MMVIDVLLRLPSQGRIHDVPNLLEDSPNAYPSGFSRSFIFTNSSMYSLQLYLPHIPTVCIKYV